MAAGPETTIYESNEELLYTVIKPATRCAASRLPYHRVNRAVKNKTVSCYSVTTVVMNGYTRI